MARVNREIQSLERKKKEIEEKLAKRKQNAEKNKQTSRVIPSNLKALEDNYIRFENRAN